MKALVALDDLAIGGSVITAIELVAAVRAEHDWEIVLYAAPGPSSELAAERGLRVINAPSDNLQASPRLVRTLTRVCRAEAPDLVHAWGPKPIYTAFVGAYLRLGLPVLGSITEMFVPPRLPPGLPITFVTEGIRTTDHRRAARSSVQDPPINAGIDDPSLVDPTSFRRDRGIADTTALVVIVSRLSRLMKLESVLQTIEAAGQLATRRDFVLAVVGDGDAMAEVEAAGAAVNERVGRRVVDVSGAMADPRPAYAAADIVVGMGTSVVRGMAFAKASVVVGEGGFTEPFTPEFADGLVDAGFYGVKPSTRARPLADELNALLADPARRTQLGSWSRDLALARFDVPVVAQTLAKTYTEVVGDPIPRDAALLAAALRCTTGKVALQTKRGVGKLVRAGGRRDRQTKMDPTDKVHV